MTTNPTTTDRADALGVAAAALRHPMSYYVSVKHDSRSVLALGPFDTHNEALDQVDTVKAYVQAHDKDGAWYSYGTARHTTARPVGKLNARLGR